MIERRSFVDAVGRANDTGYGLAFRARLTDSHGAARAAGRASSSYVIRGRLRGEPWQRPHAVHPVLIGGGGAQLTCRVTMLLFARTLGTDRIMDLAPEESETLLQELFDHLYSGPHTYAHPWTNGDFLVWDNLALQHGRPRDTVPAPTASCSGWPSGTTPSSAGYRHELIASYIDNSLNQLQHTLMAAGGGHGELSERIHSSMAGPPRSTGSE